MKVYHDSKLKRLLLSDGTSIFDDDSYIFNMFNDSVKDNDRVIESDDSIAYDKKYNKNISYKEPLESIESKSESHTEDFSDELLNYIHSSKRFSHLDERGLERIEYEYSFFEKTNNIKFLYDIMNLIKKFKEDGVVWGVGRGSSVASLLLYVMEVHDINPLKYDIDFSEMSKEDNSKWS